MSENGISAQTKEFLSGKFKQSVVNELETKANAKDPVSTFRLGCLYYFGKGLAQDVPKGIELLNQAVSLGSPDAKFLMSTLYIEGKDVRKDTRTGFKLLDDAADAEIAEAQHALGFALYEGVICGKNIKRAIRNFVAASRTGDPVDCYMAGKLMEEQTDEEPNYTKILGFYERAIKAGSLDATLAAARILRFGKGSVRKNPTQAFKYYKQVAQNGNNEAMVGYGCMIYLKEAGKSPADEGLVWLKRAMDNDYDDAFFQYGKLLAASDDPDQKTLAYQAFEHVNHIPEAKYLCGKMKIKGEGTTKSVSGGMTMIKEASKQGFIPAIYSMGIGYRENKNGVKTNIKRAYEAFQKCAEAEYHPGEYQFAYMIEKGIGCEKDIDKAIKYYRKAAEGGEAKAMFNLALIYDENKQYRNTEEAIKYYTLASNKGIKEAMYNLGMIYKNGNGVEKDLVKGRQLIMQAADKGVVNAQFWMYELDKNENHANAIKFLQKAADNGHGKAMCLLGNFLIDGTGIQVDVEQGVEYLMKAGSLIYGE